MCRFSAWLSVCCLAAGLTQSAEARQRSLNLRLTTAITSYHSRAGSQFQGVVIAPYERDGQVYLPPGTIVHGSILKSNGVGLGIKRERASLRLAFHEYELPDGR